MLLVEYKVLHQLPSACAIAQIVLVMFSQYSIYITILCASFHVCCYLQRKIDYMYYKHIIRSFDEHNDIMERERRKKDQLKIFNTITNSFCYLLVWCKFDSK